MSKSTSQMNTLKKVLRYMKKYIPLLAISIVLATVTVAMTLYFPILTGKALDLIIEKGLVDFQGDCTVGDEHLQQQDDLSHRNGYPKRCISKDRKASVKLH